MPRLTKAEIARIVGVHKSTVGRQAEAWGLVGDDGKVDLDEYQAMRAGGLDPALQTTGGRGGSADPPEPSDLVRERTRKMAADAERAELDLAERRGELVSRAAVDREQAELWTMVRERIATGLRDRAAPKVARLDDERDVETALMTELNAILGEIHGELLDAARRDPPPAA